MRGLGFLLYLQTFFFEVVEDEKLETVDDDDDDSSNQIIWSMSKTMGFQNSKSSLPG